MKMRPDPIPARISASRKGKCAFVMTLTGKDDFRKAHTVTYQVTRLTPQEALAMLIAHRNARPDLTWRCETNSIFGPWVGIDGNKVSLVMKAIDK